MDFQDHPELRNASCDRNVGGSCDRHQCEYLTGAAGLTGLGDGVTAAAGTFTVVNSTTITVTLNMPSTATPAILNIGVTTPIGTTTPLPFTVN